MSDDDATDSGEITLAFSLSAIDRLDDPNAVFEEAQTWSRSIGIVDHDTEQIGRLVADDELRQDFDMKGRDKWFALESICETTPAARHVYVGSSDDDMRVSTLFDWEYVRVTEAAKKADWTLTEPESESGILSRLLVPIRRLIK